MEQCYPEKSDLADLAAALAVLVQYWCGTMLIQQH
jgi:hypothetical protein